MNIFEHWRKTAEINRTKYPPGTRIMLLHMDDPYHPVPNNTRGTVDHIDDSGQIFMKWDNGRTLPINSDTDSFRILTAEELVAEQRTKQTVRFGDDTNIVLPDTPVDCIEPTFFDEIEYECWHLVEKYAELFGVELISIDEGETAISFDIAKGVQDFIIEQFENAGVKFKFTSEEEVVGEDESKSPVLKM